MDLRHQLVIQWPAGEGDVDSLDRLADLEVRLDDALPDDANDMVDGHDMGSGEMNLFILSNTPAVTFERIRPLLERYGPPTSCRAAYRDVDGDRWTILWPNDLREFDVV